MNLPERLFPEYRRRQNADSEVPSRRVNGNTVATPSPITYYQRDSVRQRYDNLITLPEAACPQKAIETFFLFRS
jgi:hypothetical protein